MKNILLIITLFFTFAEAKAQTTVCLQNPSLQGIQSIDLNYTVNNSNQELVAQKENGCFILDFPGYAVDDIETFTLIPQGDVEPLNCVTTFDLVLISRYILGMNEMQGNSLQQFSNLIAADVNNSGTVSTFDLVHLRQLILNVISDFPTNESWRFFKLDEALELINDPAVVQNPWLLGNSLDMNLEFTADDLNTDLNLLGIKTGDINGQCN